MSLLARITDFQPNTEIKSQPFDDELNQIVNMLAGVSQNKSIRIISNDSAFAVGRFDQRGSNHILELYADAAEVFRFEKDGDIVSPFLSSIAGVYTFSNTPVGPASNPTTDSQLARKKYVDETKTAFSVTIGFEDNPSITPIASGGHPCFFVPDGTSMTITKLKIRFSGGSHTTGGSLTYTVRVWSAAGTTVADVGSITLNNTNNTSLVTYTVDITDHVLTAGEAVTYFLDSRSGTITERAVNIGFVGTQSRIV